MYMNTKTLSVGLSSSQSPRLHMSTEYQMPSSEQGDGSSPRNASLMTPVVDIFCLKRERRGGGVKPGTLQAT